MEGAAIIRHGTDDAHQVTAEGIRILRRDVHLQLLVDVLDVRGTEDDPLVLTDGLDWIRLRYFIRILQIPYEGLDQIMHGDDTGHATIFIDDDGVVLPCALHRRKQIRHLHVLRHEERLVDRVFHNISTGLIRQTEVILRIEYTDDIVIVLAADRIDRIAVAVDRLPPLTVCILEVQHRHIRTVCADILHGQIVKLENVLDHLVFRRFDRTLLGALVEHQLDVLLGHLILDVLRSDAHHAQYTIGRSGKEPYERSEHRRCKIQDAGDAECDLLGIGLCQPLRNQLAEDDADIGKDHGDQDDRNILDDVPCDRKSGQQHHIGERLCEAVGCKRRRQESGQRDRHLNRREKLRRLDRQPKQLVCPFIAILTQLAKLRITDLQHGNLCAGKKSIYQNQYNQQ